MQKDNRTAMLTGLCVNYRKEPLALDTVCPFFGWRMESGRMGARQKAYRICVSDRETVLWDSGKVESSASSGIDYPEDAPALQPETLYRWLLQVWDETGELLEAGSSFSTGLMGKNLDAWHGASWIGPDEICVYARTIPVFRIRFEMQILPGGESAGVVFGANDPRFASSIQNNYLIHGENYIAFRVRTGQIPAAVEVYRKGYAPGEDGAEPAAVLEIPEEIISADTRYEKHSYEIVVSGNQMEVMTVDGHPLTTDEENRRIVTSPMNPDPEPTHLVLNPLKAVMDVPVYPRLCEIGFCTDVQTKAVFTGFRVLHYSGEKNEIFGEKTGAGYGIFRESKGLTVQGNTITAAPGTLVYADPSCASMPMLRRSFQIPEGKKINRVLFYATARGIFELTVNGKKVGEEYLAPGDMDFRKTSFYEAYDITGQILEGENAAGVTLASGWYNDEVSYDIDKYNFYGDRQAFLGLIAVTFADGSRQYIPTDASWQYYGEGPVRYAANFNGQTCDGRREAAVRGWDAPGYDASAWKQACIMERTVSGLEPVITAKPDAGITQRDLRTASFVAKEVRGSDQDTVYIYDMGVNMVGIPVITFPAGREGQEITIRYSEILYPQLPPDNPYCYGDLAGLILTENLRGALVTDRYVMRGDGREEVFCPRLTFHGYRYVEISGIGEAIPAENIKGIVLSSVDITARYTSSSPLVNQLFENIIRSTSGNHLSIPTDCPQRDERLGWAGDAQVYSQTAVYMADMAAFYGYYDYLQREAQGPDGTWHLYAPSYAPPGVAFALGYTWNAAGVVIPFHTYLQYGDLQILKESYPSMKRHAEGMMQKKAQGQKFLTGHIGFLGDHLSLTDTDPSLMDNAQFYRVMDYVARSASLLGEETDAAAFRAYADGLRAEWNKVFVDEQHRTRALDGTLQDTQGSYALPLMCGVFSEENLPWAQKHLERTCSEQNHTMTTGFMSTGSLLPALTEGGNAEEAYRLFEQTGYPSWLYPVVNGATTVWERWNSCTLENGFGGQNGMNSFNHYSLGAVGTWMLAYQAGIRRGQEAGFQHFVLAPVPGGSFTQVKAAYDSRYGTIESGWTAENGVLCSYECTVPANTDAVLYLPIREGDRWEPEQAQGDEADRCPAAGFADGCPAGVSADMADGKPEPEGQENPEDRPKPSGSAFAGMVEYYGSPAAVFRLPSGQYRFRRRRSYEV